MTTYFRLGENILSWGQDISGWAKISCPRDNIFFEGLFGLGSAQGRAVAAEIRCDDILEATEVAFGELAAVPNKKKALAFGKLALRF